MEKTKFIQGEEFTYSLKDDGYAAATLHVGADKYLLTKVEGEEGEPDHWDVTIKTEKMNGAYRYATIADGCVREQGSFYVVQLRSKYRDVIDAIDEALKGVATNGKYSISVGEISLTDKSFDEMVKFRNYYLRLADADENGRSPYFGPKRVCEVYA